MKRGEKESEQVNNTTIKAYKAEFDKLVTSRARWECWRDMVHIFALAISNAVDERFKEKREEEYHRILDGYTIDQLTTFCNLFSMLIDMMDENVKRGSFEDVLGQMYMEMELGNDRNGQFFTPYNLTMMMSEMQINDAVDAINAHGFITANDPACGAGATLIALADALHRVGINYQQKAFFVGCELDYTTALMCYIQLSLFGCAGYVRVGDSLRDPLAPKDVMFGEMESENCWYTPMWFEEGWQGRMRTRVIDEVIRNGCVRRADDGDTDSGEHVCAERAGNAEAEAVCSDERVHGEQEQRGDGGLHGDEKRKSPKKVLAGQIDIWALAENDQDV